MQYGVKQGSVFPVTAKGQFWVQGFQTKYSALPPPPPSTRKKCRKQLSLYALFKHTYNAQIFTKKFPDEVLPFMNSFLEKN